MDWNSAVVPLIVAAVGAIAVGIGAWIASRSALRSRLIDTMREDERERRAFQVRTVAAASELGTSTAHLISRRLLVLQTVDADARARLGAAIRTGAPSVEVDLDSLSADEGARVTAATGTWRAVLAESQVYAQEDTYNAMRAFDGQRATVVHVVNGATAQTDLIAAIVELEHAQELCDDLRGHFATHIYRELQAEMLTGTARVFFLGHVRRLRYFVKDADEKHRRGIAQVRARIAFDNNNRPSDSD